MRRLFAVSILAIAMSPLFGPACQAQALPTPVVVDRSGKVLGQMLGPNLVSLKVQADQPPVGAYLDRLDFTFRSEDFIIGWKSNDCTGTAFLNDDAVVPIAWRRGDDLYYPDPKSKPSNVKVGSAIYRSRCYNAGASGISFSKARLALTVNIASLGFKAPFSAAIK